MVNFQIINRTTGLAGMPVALTRKAAIGFPIGPIVRLIPAAPRWAISAFDMLGLPLTHAWTRTKVVLLHFCVLAVNLLATLIAVDKRTAAAQSCYLTGIATKYLAFTESVGLDFEQSSAYLAGLFNLRTLRCLVAVIRTIVQSGFTSLNIVDRLREPLLAIGANHSGASAVFHGATSYGHYTIIPHCNQAKTLIAAHRTGRRCYGCELSPRYADVILRRAEAEGLTVERQREASIE